MAASPATASNHYFDFKSRDGTFVKALKALEPDQESHMVALCGVGGVGKTTMIEKLKKVVIEKKMFNLIVTLTIGKKPNVVTIQNAVAEFLDVDLNQRSIAARAQKLRKSFEAYSDGGKKKTLVILDDLWEFVDLYDIGLSPLPNQGVDFRVLVTSRNRDVCILMGVEVNSILNVEVVEDSEAKMFFRELVNVSDHDLDMDLRKIGDDIASRCFGLPLFIKTMACTVKNESEKHVWEDTLSRLVYDDVGEVMHRVFEISYNHLQDEETRSTLLLCVLYSEDLDVRTEDLVRYGWALKLFENLFHISEARNRLKTCIDQLIKANLLIESQNVGWVKMHGLVQDFVLHMFGDHASIVGNMSKWSAKDTVEADSLNLSKYKGVYELLRACDRLERPLSRTFQSTINLRKLCFRRCSSMFECPPIGDLVNLQVLSFAHCSIRHLPPTIRNLKQLKILDMTGCADLRIDDGVLENLVKLEELYMKVADEEGIRFTDSNYIELAERSKNLLALEIEFTDNNALPKNMSFKNLEKFKVSLGCYLRKNNSKKKLSLGNTLTLVTDKSELLNSGVHELFDKTEVLTLQVDDINDLGDALMEYMQTSFHNLRVLNVCECANLRYLFTDQVANGLMNLEHLTISFCPILETLVHSGSSGVGVIKLQALKFLSLGQLPKLMSLCNSVNAIELPQLEELTLYNLPNFTSIYPHNKPSTSSMSNDPSAMQDFLNKEVVIPQLKTLKIFYMKKLKEIWPSHFGKSEAVGSTMLKVIMVEGCDSLENLFPINPMPMLHRLEELKVWNCGSIEVLFKIDLECVGETKAGCNSLRYIEAIGLGNLRNIWRVKAVNNFNIFIPSVEHIKVRRCPSLRHVIDYDMRAAMKVTIDGTDGWGGN